MKHICKLAVLLLMAVGCLMIPLSGCSRQGVYTTSYFDTFDTVLTVTLAAPGHETASAWSADIHDIAADLHKQFSVYEDFPETVNLKTVNDSAGKDNPITVSEDIMALLSLGRSIYEKSGGKVNIMLGAVLRQWHEAREDGDRLPNEETLKNALTSHAFMDSLVMNEALGTVYLSDPASSLDVGAIAKGYVLEKIRLYANEQGISSMLVNFGGQVMAIGRHPDGDPWTVAIRDPRDGSVLDTVAVENAVVTTSADDQRAYTVDGKAYHHIIYPETGYPSSLHRSVTVILPLSFTLESDGLSTALFLSDQDEIPEMLKEYDGASALWMNADGTVQTYHWPH